MQKYNIAVVGATGSAGTTTLQILEERNFPIDKIVAIASRESIGKQISFRNRTIKVQNFSEIDFSDIDVAFFCAGSNFSRINANSVTDAGCISIDKTSYFRLDPKVPLIIPEINSDLLDKGAPKGIISTPNCVAVPLAMSLKALSTISAIKRVVISTYQSVSGAGVKATTELLEQTKASLTLGYIKSEVFQKQIAFNVIPLIGNLYENGVSDEEDKISCEICKILKSDVKVAVTCVRVPTFIGHGISVACEFAKPISEHDAYEAFENFEGILTVDRREDNGVYVTPLEIQGEDAVYISRIRKDNTVKNGLMFWCLSDNLRKGAALNSIQILEEIIQKDPKLNKFKKKG